jgi:predicted ATPase
VRSDLPSGTVTFLFTDVEASTKLLHELGAERYAQALAGYRRLVRQAFAAHGGVEVDTQGDAFFAAFPTAAGALAAAREAQEALAERPIRTRMGIHTGTPLVGEEGYLGADVHLGARIAAAGHGGQVLVSKETRELADGELTDLGEHRLKDFAEPVWIFQIGSERFPPLKTISNTNLPRPASSFVGREREKAEVTALFQDGARLVTLSGPGGSGKTRLAIEVASELVPEFKNGTFWVGVAALRDPALVAETIAQTLGAKDGLTEHVGGRELLLLIDNLEQVIEAAPELAALVERCPNLRLLVTSRELLRVRGEVEYAVPPLALPDAVELFCRRSQLEPEEVIHELCRRLDSLPLAVELAAARTSVLSPTQIVERLSKRLDLLKGGRDTEARQQTLRATIEWSYDLLSDAEKTLFARLAVFIGGCTLDAAGVVAEADIDTLQALVEKSLLQGSDERFWMLDTIREYAAERLEEQGQRDQTVRGLAVYLRTVIQDGRRTLGETEDLTPLVTRIAKELDNLRAAIEWGLAAPEPELALRLAIESGRFAPRIGLTPSEQSQWLHRGLRAAGTVSPTTRADALYSAGGAAYALGDFEKATQFLEQSLRLHRDLGDDSASIAVLYQLGAAAMGTGDDDRARDFFEQSLESATRFSDTRGVSRALAALGDLKVRLGELAHASELLERSAKLARDAGDRYFLTNVLLGSGDVALAKRELSRATRLYCEAVRLSRDLNDSRNAIYGLAALAAAAGAAGNAERAGRLWGALAILEQSSGWLVLSHERSKYEDRVAACANAAPRAFAAAVDDGRTMTLDEAVDYALTPN